MNLKSVQFYRSIFGGFQLLPRFFRTEDYMELSWGVWVLSWSRWLE